jgi:hypothetical protein
MAIKTASDLVAKCKQVAQKYKTLYVMGCFGAPMTASNKERYVQNHSYNRQTTRTVMIKSATADTFGFDCVCLIKGLLWGWDGDKSKTYGGASYGSNGVPDINADQIITKCKDVSTDFSKISVGELLWMSGHVGIYIGNGQAVECTPAWKNGVQITDVLNIKSGTGHKWVKHGKLPYVSYDGKTETATPNTPKEEKPVSSGTSGLTYHIKVGAYDDKATAEAHLKKLVAAGYSGTIVTSEKAGIKVGDTVRVKQGARDFNGGILASFVYSRNHKVKEITGNRAVITFNGTVVAAVHKDNLILK